MEEFVEYVKKARIEIVRQIVNTIVSAAHTGNTYDGKVSCGPWTRCAHSNWRKGCCCRVAKLRRYGPIIAQGD